MGIRIFERSAVAVMNGLVLSSASEISAGWLTQVLAAEVAEIEVANVGTGQMADTLRVAISYADGATGPDAVVVKVASFDEHSREASRLVRCYEIETSIYRQVDPLPGVPRCLFAARDQESDSFTLVLEDLSPCTQGDELVGADLETAKAALRVMARIHARCWESSELAEYEWLNRQSLEQAAGTAQLLQSLAGPFLQRFEGRLSPQHRALFERVVPKLGQVIRPRPGPRTLCHGDFRLDNMLFRAGQAEPWVVDWQTAGWSAPGSDVAYFIGGSLTPELRRAHVDELLDTYLGELHGCGVTGYTRADLEDEVRRSSFGGAIQAFAASILVVQTERGDRMFAEMFSRHVDHAIDNDLEGTLEDAGDSTHIVAAEDDLHSHQPDDQQLWNESWYADAVSEDGRRACYIRLGLHPNMEVAWWHAAVVVDHQRVVVSSLDHLPLPTGDPAGGMRVVGQGIDVTIDLDRDFGAFGVRGTMTAGRYQQPADVYLAGAGEELSVEVDLTWKTQGVPYHWGIATRYEIPCQVIGEVRLGGENLEMSGPGQRDHSWGARDWWSIGWCWLAGHLEDGTHFHAADIRLGEGRFMAGYIQRQDRVEPVTSGRVDEEGVAFPPLAEATINDLRLTIEPTGWGPLLLIGPGGERDHFPRAAARFTTADGRRGTGWVEWNQPQ